jgi:hypothetical protein
MRKRRRDGIRPKALEIMDKKAAAHDQRTELVKAMIAKENADLDAKTQRLRQLRLAQERAAPEHG